MRAFHDALTRLVERATAIHDRKVRIVWTHEPAARLAVQWAVEVHSPSGLRLGGPWAATTNLGALTLAADHYSQRR